MTKIGLEIHCQLTRLESKLFCPCKADYRGFGPNENICPICIGLPGSLPRLNQQAVVWAAKIAVALNCDISRMMTFFRKNYFYPDLPKNFQITQTDLYGSGSAGSAGSMRIGGRDIRIKRVQLEEDPGRIVYEGEKKATFVDYNRAGTPLVEIVTEPDFGEPRQAREFMNMFSDLLANLQVANPELKGALRADGNISVDRGNRVEIKNISSFYELEKALGFEITRQEALVERGIPVAQETRHWDAKRRITIPSRSKEAEMDYRYFLEGDIPWILIPETLRQSLQEAMPESTVSKLERYIEYGIPEQVAQVLSSDGYFSKLFEEAQSKENARTLANLITTDLMGLTDTHEKQAASKLTGRHLGSLADAIQAETLSRNAAKSALHEMVQSGLDLDAVIAKLDLGRVSDESEMSGVVGTVIREEQDAFREAKDNPQAVNYLMGKIMQKTKGKADAKLVLELLREQLRQTRVQ